MVEDTNSIPVHITLTKHETEIVDTFSRETGANNRSAAIRQIIRGFAKWEQLRANGAIRIRKQGT